MNERFCKSCGTSLPADEKFCKSCGTAVMIDDSGSPSEPIAKRTKQPIKKEPFSRKKKFGLSLFAALAVIAIGAHFVFLYLTDSEKQIQAFHNAVIDGNGAALSQELSTPDNTIYDKDSFVKSLKKNDLDALIDNLSSTMDTVKETGLSKIIVDEDGLELFRLNKKKAFVFYSKVMIEPITYSVLVNTDVLDSTLVIAGTDFKLDGKSVTINNVVPTDYEVVINGKNPYFESTEKVLIDKEDFNEPVEIDLPSANYSVSFAEAPADTTLYINGKSTDKLIKDIAQISPVFSSGATFHAVRKLKDGKTEKSEEVEDIFDDKIAFQFPLLVKAEEDAINKAAEEKEKTIVSAQQAEINDEKIRQASFVYDEYRYAYEDALNYENFSAIEHYLYGSGEAYDELSDFVYDSDDSYHTYSFITNEVKSGEVIDGAVHLNVYEVFNFENEDGKTTRYERNKEYIFIEVSPERYQISKININKTNKN